MRYEEKFLNVIASVAANKYKSVTGYSSIVDPMRIRVDLLEHLSKNFGFDIDRQDLEKQRSFVALAAQFIGTKGSHDSFKALMRSYGYKSEVIELYGTDLLVGADTDGDIYFTAGSKEIVQSRIEIPLTDAAGATVDVVGNIFTIPGSDWYEVWSPTPDPGESPSAKMRLMDKGFYLYIDDYKDENVCEIPATAFGKNPYGKYVFFTDGEGANGDICPLDSPKIMKNSAEKGDYVSFKITFEIDGSDVDVYAYDDGGSYIEIVDESGNKRGILRGDGGDYIGKIRGWVDYNTGDWYLEMDKFPKLSSSPTMYIVAHYGQGLAGEYPIKSMTYDGTNTYVSVYLATDNFYRAKSIPQDITGIYNASLKDRYRKWYNSANQNDIGSLGIGFVIQVTAGPSSTEADTGGIIAEGLSVGSEPIITRLTSSLPGGTPTNRRDWEIEEVWIEDNKYSAEYNLPKAKMVDGAVVTEVIVCNEFEEGSSSGYIISSVLHTFFNMPSIEFERELLLTDLSDSPYARISRKFFIEIMGLTSEELSDEEFFERISKRILEITPITSEFVGFYYPIKFINETPAGPDWRPYVTKEVFNSVMQVAIAGEYQGRVSVATGLPLTVSAIVSQNVIAYYKFNDDGTDAINSHDLTLSGTPSPVYVGSKENFSQCISFDGPLSSTSIASVTGLPTTTDFSVSCLVYIRDTVTSSAIIWEGNGYDYVSVIDPGAVYCSVDFWANYTGSPKPNAVSEAVVPLNTWVFLTFVHDSTLKKNYIYMNGNDITDASDVGTGTRVTETAMTIGNRAAQDRCFDGMIDYFIYWGIKFDARQVKLLYLCSTYELNTEKIPFGSSITGVNTVFTDLNETNLSSGIDGDNLLIGGYDETNPYDTGVVVEIQEIIDATHLLVSGVFVDSFVGPFAIHKIIDYAFMMRVVESTTRFTRGYFLTDFAGEISRIAVLDMSGAVILDESGHSVIFDVDPVFYKASKVGIFFEIEYET